MDWRYATEPTPFRPNRNLLKAAWTPTPIVGWRTWRFNPGYDVVTAPVVDVPWDRWPHIEAEHLPGRPHPAPHWGCNCGVNAYKDLGRLHTGGIWLTAEKGTPILLVGRVALYGKVIEYEHGWRAERATILDVWVALDPALARKPVCWLEEPPRFSQLVQLPGDVDVNDMFVPVREGTYRDWVEWKLSRRGVVCRRVPHRFAANLGWGRPGRKGGPTDLINAVWVSFPKDPPLDMFWKHLGYRRHDGV